MVEVEGWSGEVYNTSSRYDVVQIFVWVSSSLVPCQDIIGLTGLISLVERG